MKLNIPALGQKDSRWKDKKLGTSTVSTIGGYGCLLTCAAMICKYFGKDTDPARLNDAMVKVKGFYNGSYWSWTKLNDVYSDITLDLVNDYIECADVPAPLDKIDKLLEQRIPVMVKVDFSPEAGIQEHWVLIIGKEGDYLLNDPWTGETYFFTSKYGEPTRYIFKIVAYRGLIENKFHLFQGGVEIKTYDQNPDDIIADLQTKLKTANDQLTNKILEADGYRNELAKQETDNKDLGDQLLATRIERDKVIREKKDLEGKMDDLDKRLLTLSEEQKALSEALAVLHAQKLKDFSSRELLVEVFGRFFRRG